MADQTYGAHEHYTLRHTHDERLPLLIQTPAAVRFVSCEPLLGPIDFRGVKFTPGAELDALRSDGPYDARLDWVIVGGESGPKHRALDLAWVRALREQCRNAGVAYFGKQLGGARPGVPLPGDLGDREWPE